MKNSKQFILILLIAVVVNLSSCKKDPPPVEQPFVMPSEVIHKIIVDKQGIKWFATEKGIVSYDGVKWTTYSDDKNLSNGPIADLAFDLASGIKLLWSASQIGLNSYEFGATAISFVNYSTKNSGILADTVTAVGIDAVNVKYVGTSKGMSILKAGKWDKYLGRKNEEILARFRISSVSTTTDGYVYASTRGGGVSRFKYTDAISGATTFNKPWAWGLPSDTVYTVYTDGIAQWYGTKGGIAYHSTESTKTDWKTYTRSDKLICDSVYAIAKDLSGNMWFGTQLGVSMMKDSVTWTSYTTKEGLVSNKVNTIATDLDGSLWFGTDQGISHFVNNKWEKY